MLRFRSAGWKLLGVALLLFTDFSSRSLAAEATTTTIRRGGGREDHPRAQQPKVEDAPQRHAETWRMPNAPDGSKWNVLMIIIDDMNDWVGHLKGHPQSYTPNIDKLASEGIAFLNAYAASTICTASRAASLFGIRPTTSGIYTNKDSDWFSLIGHNVNLIQYFKDNGYETYGTGKIFPGEGTKDPANGPQTWTWYSDGPFDEPESPEDECLSGSASICGKRMDYGPLRFSETKKKDYSRTSWMIDRLNEYRPGPSFLTLGLSKPHLPWKIPEKYFDMFPLSEVLKPVHNETDVDDLPPLGVRMALNGIPSNTIHKFIVEEDVWEDAVQAYFAASAFADEMVGRVMEALDNSIYANNTIVCLWSDHGQHLGQKMHWKKGTLWEDGTRVPHIYRIPGVQGGQTCDAHVDLMSLYPTLVEMCGLPPVSVEGDSIVPLLNDVNAAWDIPAQMAYDAHMALRYKHWRLVQYSDGAQELYDRINDKYEWINLAIQDGYEDIIASLSSYLPENPAEQRPVARVHWPY